MLDTKISVLCVDKASNYFDHPELDLWTKERDAYNFKGTNPVITHAPCSQWSKLKALASLDTYEKELAWFCYIKVEENGGIFEHPAYSSFFKEAKIDRKKIYSIDQGWFGFPGRKPTWLYINGYKPHTFPLNFNAYEKKVATIHSGSRSRTPEPLIQWFIKTIKENKL